MQTDSTSLLGAGLALGIAFGLFARWGKFCLLRGLRQIRGFDDESPPGQAPALQAFALALAIALLSTQALALQGGMDLSLAQVVRTNFSVLATLTGGLLFGIGMVLARSCGARALVLLAGGNLRSLVTLLCLGLAAQATLTGVLAPVRQWLQAWGTVQLEQASLTQQLLTNGWSPAVIWAVAAGLPALLLAGYALRQPALRQHPAQLLSAGVIGLLVAAGWWVTAHIGVDPFEPAALTSLSFIGPVADSLLYLQLAVGRTPDLGLAMVAGTLIGAFITALLTRSARWEGFDSPGRLAGSITGGLLMGFGGVLAVGCSIGQGLSGLSTLAWASLPAVIGIVAGALLTLQVQAKVRA